jgi:tRNA-dihydrouridine synthase
MKYYLAPMEGLTGYVFRQTHHEYYASFDKYFTPFISPTKKKILKTRERKDVDPANNEGMTTIPQILTNNAENFIYTTSYLADQGYTEVNLNLGCPSPTVVTKNKGAGFLNDPDKLDRFFDEIFNGVNDTKISVKTRLGMYFASEFEDILKVYNRYPISELIIHPRVREDYYNGSVKMDVFAEALKNTSISVCYNGDVFSVSDARRIEKEFPNVNAIMIGRGILKNPNLINEILGNDENDSDTLKEFHEALLNKYIEDLKSERDVMFKMKEMWAYLGESFKSEPGFDKNIKKIRKASNVSEYRVAVNELIK